MIGATTLELQNRHRELLLINCGFGKLEPNTLR
jgi:hypothetical protein